MEETSRKSPLEIPLVLNCPMKQELCFVAVDFFRYQKFFTKVRPTGEKKNFKNSLDLSFSTEMCSVWNLIKESLHMLTVDTSLILGLP